MSDTTTTAPATEPDAPGLVAELHKAAKNAEDFDFNYVADAYRMAAKIAAPYEAAWQEVERDLRDSSAEIVMNHMEIERLRLLACTCGARPSPCLLCGAKAPCGLHAPGPDGKPDPEAGLVCEFDTFEGVIDALNIERKRVAELEKVIRDDLS